MESTDIKQETVVPAPSPAPEKKAAVKVPKPRKKRKWIRNLIILAVVAGLLFWFIVRPILAAGDTINSMLYTQAAAACQDITVAVSGTATVQPVDSYKVTALVKGEILDAPFEEGDQVNEGDLLYQIDAGDVENSIQRSEIGLQQSRLSYNDLLKNKADSGKNTSVKANADGVITKLYYKEGDTVGAGTAIADLLDREHMLLTVPFHALDAAGIYVGAAATVQVGGTGETLYGTVDSIAVTERAGLGGTLVREITIQVNNPGALSDQSTGTATIGAADCAESGSFAYAAKKTVSAKTSGTLEHLYIKEGDTVTDGQLLGSFEATDLDTQIESSRLGLESTELALQATRDQLENYTITSPISGTVIEKNFKTGDNLDATTGGYMAVIYDMSKLTFKMNIDELDIGKIKVGQEVRITAKALEGQEFTGAVSNININGVTAGGVTSYPVTVDINNPGSLLPGMNVSAEILVEHAQNVLSIPVEMVGRGDTVQVLPAGAVNKDGTPDYSKLEERQVTLGRNDDSKIEILSGLQEGDVVVHKMDQTSLMQQMMQAQMGGAASGSMTTVTYP